MLVYTWANGGGIVREEAISDTAVEGYMGLGFV